ncbi:MAG TPA: 2-C-methyl-D-erythritol 4-phosphate cytidylyltransferase [Psychrobacter pasteurii]|uniref:2-C-methyl-D-erythritol 4-phosphate cytidylyltransferase n=1 Tax=Psychrobacter pasteurii TaxID=1945520 RepID=A0A1R4EFM2_9GAMM|nr:2-C-methyl-D-erythritol 4-phosphate cytidylyltransferase [Psychrobacter pasteurii]SJM37287.1 2-C-methyl-D-erythritol 4-phosphate cytidylyltransferase [Psychrobacter pasteurii]HJH10076.1 2-C-methyl-D-erythritol 4-phosphate cytidylyltransferase [Psychrobacter pasteurii]
MTATTSASALPDSTLPKVFSLIVAAGKGSRFGSDIPKQYTPVHGKTILQQSVTALAASSYIRQLLLVIAKDDSVAKDLDFSLPVTFTEGGAERWQSVQAGVEAVFAAGAKDEDLILIHDAARPCVLAKHIDLVIEAAMQHPYGAILGVPVADTLKKVSVEGDIQATIDRSSLWQAQTPQVFRAAKLRQVLSYVADNGLMITDEASAFEAMGHAIKIVPGNNQNLKLTYAEDLTLIESILSSR